MIEIFCRRGSDPADLYEIHVELVIEGKLKPRGWPILFEQTHTEFMFKQLNLTLMSGLEERGTMFCLELQHFNLTVHSTSELHKIIPFKISRIREDTPPSDDR